MISQKLRSKRKERSRHYGELRLIKVRDLRLKGGVARAFIGLGSGQRRNLPLPLPLSSSFSSFSSSFFSSSSYSSSSSSSSSSTSTRKVGMITSTYLITAWPQCYLFHGPP